MLATLTTRFARLGTMVGTMVVLSTVLAPAALAQVHVAAPPPHPAVPAPRPATLPEHSFVFNNSDQTHSQPHPTVHSQPARAGQPVPLTAAPVPMPALQAAVLPSLERVLPDANFAQNPPQFLPLQNGNYALVSPALFCATDQAGTCEAMAAQLAQMTPGWGTAVLNGPEGNGVYLTQQGYASGG